MCGMLSSIRRATAMFLISSKPVVFGMCCSGVLSGWKASGMKVTKPLVSSCSSRSAPGDRRDPLRSRCGRRAWCSCDCKPELMRDARCLEPLVAVDLVVADDAAHALVEDLGAAAGQRIHAGVAAGARASRDRDLVAPREVGDLHHGEGLQVHLREALLQAAQHLAVPVERQLGMQAADDVELGDRFASSPRRRGARPRRATSCRPWDRAPACRTRTAGNWRRRRRSD